MHGRWAGGGGATWCLLASLAPTLSLCCFPPFRAPCPALQIGGLQGAAQLLAKFSGSVSGALADVVSPASMVGWVPLLLLLRRSLALVRPGPSCRLRCRPPPRGAQPPALLRCPPVLPWPVPTSTQVILGAALTAANKPMYAASGAVAAVAGTAACVYWVAFAKARARGSAAPV